MLRFSLIAPVRAFQFRESLAAACVSLHLVLVQHLALHPALGAPQVLGVVVTILGAGGRHAGVVGVHLGGHAVADGAAVEVVLAGVEADVLEELGLGDADRASLAGGRARRRVRPAVHRVVDLGASRQHSDLLACAVPHEFLHVAQIGDGHRQLVPS